MYCQLSEQRASDCVLAGRHISCRALASCIQCTAQSCKWCTAFLLHALSAKQRASNCVLAGRRISCTALASCLLTVLGVLTIGWHDQLLQYIEHLTEAVQAVQAVHGVQPEAVQSAVQSAVSSAPHGADLPISGVLFGLAAAAANAAAFVCVGVIGPSVSPWSLTWWQHLVVTHVAAAAILAQNLGQANTQLSSSKVSELSSLLSSIGGGGSAAAAAGLCGTNSTSSNTMSDVWSDLTAQTSDALGQLVLPRSSGHDALLLLGVVAANFMGQLLLNAGFQRMDAGRGSAINTSQVGVETMKGLVKLIRKQHSTA